MYYRIMNLASAWIANSEATAADVRPRARRPLAVITNALDLGEFDARAREGAVRRSADEPTVHRIAMVASLLRWKNYRAFLRVAARVRSERPHVHFLIVGGGDSTHIAELQADVRSLGLAECVEFTGFIDNIPALLTGIDILLHTTEHEPFGRVFIEAMAAERPVVAFDNGGAAEIVLNDVTGSLVPSGDLAAMTRAIIRLLDNPDLREQMGRAGRARVEERYGMDRHCAAIAAVYEALQGAS